MQTKDRMFQPFLASDDDENQTVRNSRRAWWKNTLIIKVPFCWIFQLGGCIRKN